LSRQDACDKDGACAKTRLAYVRPDEKDVF
jgi:hypothetical protein